MHIPTHQLILRRTTEGNLTSNATTFWVDGPDGRGTYDLILSCLTTLFLCAWTAVHLNVDASSTFKSILSRIEWMLIAVFAPEVVLFLSWHQFCAAKMLRDKINAIGRDAVTGASGRSTTSCPDHPAPVSPRPSRHNSQGAQAIELEEYVPRKEFSPWTMREAFYGLSGGFAIDTNRFWHKPRLTLTPAGILQLAREGLLPQTSKEAIEDKSKADTFAKLLVFVQAGWFVAQSFARLIQGLPITLLEIHTLTHIACALAMYIIWFKKPYNVMYPTVLEDETTISMGALFALNTTFSGRQWACCQTSNIDVRAVRNANPAREDSPKVFEQLVASNKAVDYLRQRGSHFGWSCFSDGAIHLNEEYLVPRRSNYHIVGSIDYDIDTAGSRSYKISRRNYILLVLVSTLYGGAHLSAWAAYFPTVVEMWMWRVSAFSLIIGPFACVTSANSDKFLRFEWMDPDTITPGKQKKQKKRQRFGGYLLAELSCWAMFFNLLLIALYPFARLCLLAESFASLRGAPRGIYGTVNWAGFIPHVG